LNGSFAPPPLVGTFLCGEKTVGGIPIINKAILGVPHFDLPFRLGSVGAICVEQDTIDDIANCVTAIVSTHLGWRAEVPTFGIPDVTMRRQPLGSEDISNWIANQEPRALLVVEENPDKVDQLVDHINIGVSIVQKGGS
jgi:hypothetical protein